ncbi:hypothetical protein B5D77_10585 [Microcystis sp. MC19]|nr:hypothetical protein B5D77_10585 [Microcystis sp. MC19]
MKRLWNSYGNWARSSPFSWVESVGGVERINGLKKTSQFSGKGKPNSQHLNPSESAIANFVGCINECQAAISLPTLIIKLIVA